MKNYVDAKALQEYTTKLVAKLKTLFPGTPTAAATVAEMTDHSKTYVYVGTESGYTAGDWYYWNGTAWTSGGPFQATSIITDTTLAVAGEAADAKATGDAIAAVKTAVLNAMAPAYSPSGTYTVGVYVNHNGAIYRCTTAITTAEAWTAGHWTEVPLGTDLADQVGALKESLDDIAEAETEILSGTRTDSTFINSSHEVESSAASFYVKTYNVSEGETLLVSGIAFTNCYLFVYENNNDEVIAWSEQFSPAPANTIKDYYDYKTTVPVNAVKIVVCGHTSSVHPVPNVVKVNGYVVKGLSVMADDITELQTDVTNIEDNIDGVEDDINDIVKKTDNTNKSITPLFEYSYSEATGEIIDTFSEITGVNIENAESAVIRSAQIFEAVLPTTTQNGVTFTKNDDGTYTINGSHKSSLVFNLNQSTRTGTDKLITLQGNYSIRVTVLSGDCDTSGAAYGDTYGLFLFRLANATNALSVSLEGNDKIKEKAVVSDPINVAIAVSTVANVVYNNLRIKISVNKGDKLLDTDCDYVAPVTITNMSDALTAAQNCTPCVWIAASPNTAKITVFGKKVKEVEIPDPPEPEPQEPVNWYGVIEKYNDRVDTLMQMFTKPLFLVYTDIHASLDNLERINTWANANKSSIYVSDTYCLGDMLYDHPGDDRPITNFDNVAIWPKTLKVIGNHDVGTGSSELTAKQTYDAYIAPYISQWGNVVQPTDAATDGKSYYYKDYSSKIRIIVLDIYHYDSAQSTWFETVLSDAITNSLAVIIAQHADICTAAEKEPLSQDYPFARKHNGYTGLQYSLSYTSQRAAVDTFIENGGTFICWLTGHMHADMAGTYTGTHGKQLSIVLANAGMSIDGTYLRFNNYSQDCFTYLAVDTDTNYLYLLRIGESVDKWFHKNLFLCYDYVNHAVVEYH